MSAISNSPNQNGNQLFRWIRGTINGRGWAGALHYYARGTFELICDLTPTRRKARYGDIDYDFDHAVDTTWANVGLRTRIRELLSGGQYQPSEPGLFHEILSGIPSAIEGSTFIDLGSGKGRTLLMAADYAFRCIIGVEILRELNQIAQSNIARYQSQCQKCFNIESICEDAGSFRFPNTPTVLYLFNPFPEHVLRDVLENLHASCVANPRAVYVLYHNLVYEGLFREQTWLREVSRTPQYAIYRVE